MSRKAVLWILLALIGLICTGCSTDNSNSGSSQTESVKPPPQVRVEILPSATSASLPLPEETITPTLEPTAAPAEIYVWPTPDEDAIINQIESMMDQIDQKLNRQDLNLKP